MGIASRREAESWISAGRITVNGKLITEQGQKIQPGVDAISIDGQPVRNAKPPRVYWMLHKPDEVMTARVDGFGRPTIYDLPRIRDLSFLVSPVGRLDFRTEGLLLLTNDGELAAKLMHPSFHVPRHYHVLITGRLSSEAEAQIRRGVTLEDGPSGPADLRYAHGRNLGLTRGSWYTITVHEGRNRLVRRLFEHLGHRVVRLIRVGFGDLHLPEDLPAGEYRQLTSAQIHSLRRAVRVQQAPGEARRH